MKTRTPPLLVLLLTVVLSLTMLPSARAEIRIYKVKVTAKATFFKTNSFSNVGYLIYDTTNPGAAQTIQVFQRTKTFRINDALLDVLAPAALGFFTLDRNNDQILDTEGATGAFQNGGFIHAMTYIGIIPRNGFRIANKTFFQTARSLKGKGSVNVAGTDFFTRTDTFTIDPLSANINLATTQDGVTVVRAQLEGKGFLLDN